MSVLSYCGKIAFLPDGITHARLRCMAPIYVGHKLAMSTLSAYICFEGQKRKNEFLCCSGVAGLSRIV
jgi:hypothetical protein